MIVSNTTPISNLIQLDVVRILGILEEAITITTSVAKELDEGSDFLGNWREKCEDFS